MKQKLIGISQQTRNRREHRQLGKKKTCQKTLQLISYLMVGSQKFSC